LNDKGRPRRHRVVHTGSVRIMLSTTLFRTVDRRDRLVVDSAVYRHGRGTERIVHADAARGLHQGAREH
jgi:hypothetical protein